MIKNEQERQRIGQRIAELRKAVTWTDELGIRRKGMTQAELAARVGCLSQSHIARIEAGRYSVGFDHLQAIAGALDCRLDIVQQ